MWNNDIASCAICLWNMVSYIKGGIKVKGIWILDPELNIWTEEGWEWGVEKAPQWVTHSLYHSPNKDREIKCRRLRWAARCVAKI